MKVATIDFETQGIVVGSSAPPQPIGVAIKIDDGVCRYYGFGHDYADDRYEVSYTDKDGFIKWVCVRGPSAIDSAKLELEKVVNGGYELVFHNAKFDLRVMKNYFRLFPSDWSKVHDTVLLLFLLDPNQKKLGLKESAERLLDIKPTEKDMLKEFMLNNQDDLGVKISSNKKKENYYMKMLKYAPFEVVGEYACNDVEITYKLYKYLEELNILTETQEQVTKRLTPKDAYDCERELLFNLIEMEEIGIRLNVEALKKEIDQQLPAFKIVEEWVKKKLGNPDINLNSAQQIVAALIKYDMIDVDKATLTPTGKISTAQESLEEAVTDKQFVAMYSYRTKLANCLNTYLIPWHRMSSNNDGILYTTWNQTALESKDGSTMGARTGRLSSSPNLQNFPKIYKPLFKDMIPLDHPKRDELLITLPELPVEHIPSMPNMRSFVIPRYDDHVLIDLDYAQQEIRLLAHFENGTLMREYQNNPKLDVHKFAQKLLYDNLGQSIERDTIKIMVFSIIYGKGDWKLAKDLGCSFDEAKALKEAYYQVFPGVQEIDNNLKERAAKGLPFWTLGGRKVYCEPPVKTKDGVWKDLAYKMINTALQGSGGDSIKMAINNYMRVKPKNHLLVVTVHDQMLCSVPTSEAIQGISILKEAMESVPCDVKLLAEGKGFGATSWDKLK